MNFSSCRQLFVSRAMEGASGNYAFVRGVIEMKRTSSSANAKLRLRLVVIFSLVREELKAV